MKIFVPATGPVLLYGAKFVPHLRALPPESDAVDLHVHYNMQAVVPGELTDMENPPLEHLTPVRVWCTVDHKWVHALTPARPHMHFAKLTRRKRKRC